MRIVLVGTLDPGGITASYQRALEAAGCEVACFDPTRERVRHALVQRLRCRPLIGSLVEDRALEHLNYQLSDLLQRERPQALLVQNGTWALPGTLAAAQLYGCRTVNLWGEPLLHFNRWYTVPALPFYDVTCVFARSLMPAFGQAGARRVEYHPLAWDPDLHPPAESFSESELAPYRVDVAFVGKWSPERARWLEPLAGLELAIWGDGTWKQYLDRRSPLRARWRGRGVVGREYAMACVAAKICLNFIEPAAEGSANMRTFELAGIGCFQLALRNAAHQELFEEGREIECFSTPQELRAKIERYLADDGARRAIGRAAHRKAAAEHTYRHRAERVLTMVRESLLMRAA